MPEATTSSPTAPAPDPKPSKPDQVCPACGTNITEYVKTPEFAKANPHLKK